MLWRHETPLALVPCPDCDNGIIKRVNLRFLSRNPVNRREQFHPVGGLVTFNQPTHTLYPVRELSVLLLSHESFCFDRCFCGWLDLRLHNSIANAPDEMAFHSI